MHKSPKTTETENRKFVSAQELAPLMGVTHQTIRNWILRGDIRVHRIGHRSKIPVNEALRIPQHYGFPVPGWLKFGNKRK
jgi:excisionase family DNA binding protein